MNFESNKNIIVVAPHPDDEVLGCGGVIQRFIESGSNVDVIFICTKSFLNRNSADYAYDCQRKLGYRTLYTCDFEDQQLEGQLLRMIQLAELRLYEQYDIAFIPFYGDNNQDHRLVFEACQVIFRPQGPNGCDLYCYEVPSSTDQSPKIPQYLWAPNTYVELTEDQLLTKVCAFNKYQSQIQDIPHPRNARYIEALATIRGADVGYMYAESFMCLRQKNGIKS